MSDVKPGKGIPLLIGFAESLAAIEVAWSLNEAGFEVFAFCREGARPPLRLSRHVQILDVPAPELDALGCLEALLKHKVACGVAGVMPLDDFAVWLCARLQSDLVVPVIGPTGARTELALDKRCQIAAAAAAGISVPDTLVASTLDEASMNDRFPAFYKGAEAVHFDGTGLSKGRTLKCADKTEAERELRRWNFEEPLLIQPLIEGRGEGVFGLADGKNVCAWSAHQRIRMMNPDGSGSSACKSINVQADVRSAVCRMMVAAGWRGMFMIELLRGDDGQLWFMELNGRPWGSMALARRQGLEYPAWASCQALGLPFEAPDGMGYAGVTCRHLGRELVHLLMVLRGPSSRASTKWPGRLSTLWNLLCPDPHAYWYNVRAGDLSVFLDDAVRTVWERIKPTQRRHG